MASLGCAGLARDIDVVQVVIAEGAAIGEGGKVGRGQPIGADDGRDPAPASAAAAGPCRDREFAAGADRPLVEGRDPAAERVDEMDLDGLDGCRVDVAITQGVRIGGESLRQRPGLRTDLRRPCRPPRPRLPRLCCPPDAAADPESAQAEDDTASQDCVGHGTLHCRCCRRLIDAAAAGT